ncbi:hypothetical protein P154DRAFT_564388 [Amniculicola lignicola CBS 123094]|uniref:DUF7924 domain-containing protein n=1 Tax=Amniculicola lignicola CBS 123094 TaxID=1392246 RepID=A0A6A5WA97_9PLEO|nr:hypothetical protein P154DRAFT_564388 [Amniculicola lignicola CBS 123094]
MFPRKRARSETCAAPGSASLRLTKRRAVCSSPPSPQPQHTLKPSLPLTQQNLQALEDSQKSPSDPINTDHTLRPAMSRPSSPTRPNNNLDTSLKLAAYQILVDYGHELPLALKEHVSTTILVPRDPNVPLSPNAAKIKQQRRVATQQNERNGIKRIEPYMLFRGAAEDDPRVSAAPLVYSKDDINLHRYFLPPAPDKTVKEDWKELSQPRPDTAIGYVTRRDAQSTEPPSLTAFTAREERLLDAFCLTQYLLFPFLTSQWKTPNSNENISHAHNQAARDGAAIVNYLYEFYSLAYPDQKPVVVDTAHYSLTCDLHTAQIWVHWRDEEGHHMEMIYEFSLRKENEIVEGRGILKNILSHALGDRLVKIKDALPAFEKSRVRGKGPTVRAGMSTSTLSEAGSEFRFQLPMTPGSSVSEPTKRRKLAEGRIAAVVEAKGVDTDSVNNLPDLCL